MARRRFGSGRARAALAAAGRRAKEAQTGVAVGTLAGAAGVGIANARGWVPASAAGMDTRALIGVGLAILAMSGAVKGRQRAVVLGMGTGALAPAVSEWAASV